MKYTISMIGQGNNKTSDTYVETADLIYKTRKIGELLHDAAHIMGSSTLKTYLELAGLDISIDDIGDFPGVGIEIPYNKRIIGIDGVNGAGKTTILNKLRTELESKGISTRIMKPILSDSLYGSISRSLFRDMYMSFDVFTDTLVLIADHHYVISEVLPQVQEEVIFFDRSKYSIIAIQSARMHYDEHVPLDTSIDICARLCTHIPDFPVKIIINVDTGIALERLKLERNNREVDTDTFEFDQRQIEIFNIVNKNYYNFAEKFEFINVDGNKSISEVAVLHKYSIA